MRRIGRVLHAKPMHRPRDFPRGLSNADSHPLEGHMTLGLLLLIITVLLLLGAVPAWPHSRGWGYAPSGGLGLLLVILIVMMLLGYIHI